MENSFRLAIIGGWGHQSITPALGKDSGVELVAVAGDGRDDAARRHLDLPYGRGVAYYDHFEEMLDRVKPDLVSIGAQPACSGPPIIAALRRSAHVISDKPIADNAAELATIQNLMIENPGLHLLTEFIMRVYPVWLKAREIVRDGKIGKVALVTAQKSYRFGESRPDFYKTREGYPGTIAYIGCHLVDLIYWVTGLRYTCAQGLQGNVSRPDYAQLEDHAALLMATEQGKVAVITLDYLRPEKAPSHGDDRMRIAGSEGVLEVRDGKCILMTSKEAPQTLSPPAPDDSAIAEELLETIRGRGSDAFSSSDSLYMAEIMLKVRDIVDNLPLNPL